MIYKPKYLEPKNKAVDASVDNVFSWQSQGEPQTHYQLKIYELPNTLIYDSTKLAGDDNEYTLPASSLTNNKEYKWTVETFGASGSATSNEVYLKTNAKPTVTLIVPASLTVQSYTIIATYAQTDGISMKQYKFIMYDDADNVIDDTGWLYDYSLTYILDGLISGNTYKVECLVVAQNGLDATSGKQSFTVSYLKPDATRSIITIPQNDRGSMLVRWDTLKQVTPVITGDYSYVEGKFEKGLKLEDGSDITYTEDVEVYFTHQFYRQYPVNFTGVIQQMDDDFIIGYEDGRFYVVNQHLRFTSDIVDLANIFEDFEGITWQKAAEKYTTWNDLIAPNLTTYLFFQLTFSYLVVKRNGRTIAVVDMSKMTE